MKKLTLSSQILILFIIIFLASSVAFSITSMTVIRRIIADEAYNKLSSYAILLDESSDVDLNKFKIGDIAYVIKTNDTYEEHDLKSLNSDFSNEDINNILALVSQSRSKYPTEHNSFIARDEYKSKNNLIYYACKTEDNLKTYTLVMTSEQAAVNPLFISLAARINSIFFAVMLVTMILIFIWSHRLTTRLKNIQTYVLDLTDENKNMKINDDGCDEVSELSRSVEHMKEEILHNEHIKQEMLQNLSHDFKTPIAVIRNYAEAMDDEVEDPKVATKKIIEQADILKNKVNRLLQYNSLEYLSKDKEFEDILMNEIINDIVINYKHQLGDIKLSTELEEEVFFKGYKENWYTVVDNIVDNAKRYAKTEIKIILKKDKLIIYNDGDHLEDKFVDEIFKPYEKGSKGQFGLGMSIVQKTVNFFNMTLSAKNENVGVSFTIEGKNEL